MVVFSVGGGRGRRPSWDEFVGDLLLVRYIVYSLCTKGG